MKLFSFLTLLILLSFNSSGQTNIHLVKDINQNQKTSYIGNLCSYNNLVFFRVNTPEFGEEVWKSDGTENGTVLLKDIKVGAEGSFPNNFVVANGFLFFMADGKLWKSDGTSNGTIIVSLGGSELCVSGNDIFFRAYDDGLGLELWKYSTITNATTLVKNINAGANSSNPTGLKIIDGILYFSANDGVNGYEPWRSDGTEAGTTLIKDINTGAASSLDNAVNPVQFVKAGANIFFFAKDNTNGYELWKTDGTTANTALVKNMYSGDTKGYMGVEFNNELYYMPKNPLNSWYELWKSDGTNAGTLRVSVGPLYHFNLQVLNTELFYSINYQLWKTNGMTNTLLKNNFQSFSNGIIYNNKYYFAGNYTLINEDNAGLEIWETDGTSAGTVLFKNVATGKNQLDLQDSSPRDFVLSNNQMFFVANDGIHGYELWKSDGTNAGTNLIKDIYQVGNRESFPSEFHALGDKFIFKAAQHHNITNALESDIFISQDSTGNTINPIFESEFTISNIVSNNKTALFAHGNNSYKLKDDLSGSELLPFSLVNTDFSKAELNNELYFTAHNFSLSDIRIYKMNTLGVSAPVHNNHYHASSVTKVNNLIFFKANSASVSSGTELWRTDGTAAGTVLVKDIYQGSNSGLEYSSPFIAFNGILYFVANDGTYGSELWRSDGTNAGTYMVRDIHLGVTGSLIFKFIEFNNKIYFLVDEGGTLGKHLWTTDGTSGGTQLVSTFNNTWTQIDYSLKIEIANNLMFFSVKDGSYFGYSLWKSDGSNSGTTQLKDAQNHLVFCNGNILGVGGFLVFGGYYPLSGYYFYRLCKTDGTPTGTSILNNISPVNFFRFKNKVFFAGNDDVIGHELWSLDLPDCQIDRTFVSPTHDFTTNIHKYEATNGITATNKISGSANVIYDASKYIILNAGFQASSGTVFKAQIDGCGNN